MSELTRSCPRATRATRGILEPAACADAIFIKQSPPGLRSMPDARSRPVWVRGSRAPVHRPAQGPKPRYTPSAAVMAAPASCLRNILERQRPHDAPVSRARMGRATRDALRDACGATSKRPPPYVAATRACRDGS